MPDPKPPAMPDVKDIEEARARLTLMASGSKTWDLSPNDEDAIRTVLAALTAAIAERDAARAELARLRGAIAAFCAAARADVPDLLTALDAAEARIAALESELRKAQS
jgi:hypothetical protein